MRPATSPIRPVSSSSSSSGGRRRRQDLTLPLPQRDVSNAVPLPLPPLSAPAYGSSSSSFPGGVPTASGAGSGFGFGIGHGSVPPNATHLPYPVAPSSTSSSSLSPPPALSDLERVRRIGSGSGGMVWMVRHRTTNRTYALKVIYGNHDDNVRRQILREIEILRTADSPFVVRCHGMYDHGGEIQVLLEYMDRGSLEGKRITSEPVLASVAAQVLRGLEYLHRRKIVHRDIKPSNLLTDSHSRVKIADFGVSRILAQTMDPCNSSVGTIAYMSPERINTDLNQGVYDGYAGDIWSFGLSILEFYLGRFPFGENVGRQGDWASLMCAICYADPPQAPPTASREFRSFVSCCLQKEPAKRLTAGRLLQHPFITQANAVAAGQAQVNSLMHPPPAAGPQQLMPPPPPPLSS